MAGVLAAGEGAVLSHRSAAELWGLLEVTDGQVHVTIPGTGGPVRRSGIRVHRSPIAVAGAEVRDDIPVTSPSRTLQDLRVSVAPHVTRRARRQAEYLGLELGSEGGDGSRSDLESAFLALCRRHGIPRPEVNARVGRFTADFLWRAQGLAVETDGWAAHRGRQAFEDDRQRDLDLACVGIRVLRFSGRQIHRRPSRVAAAVKRGLRAPGLVD